MLQSQSDFRKGYGGINPDYNGANRASVCVLDFDELNQEDVVYQGEKFGRRLHDDFE
jgi:hypothetical protein